MDIFEAFDELLVLKPGGVCVYFGPLGFESQSLISYFQASSSSSRMRALCRLDWYGSGWAVSGCPCPGWTTLDGMDLCVPRPGTHPSSASRRVQAIPGVASCPLQYNPANWMLEQTSPASENKLSVDFGEIYKQSATCK